MVGPVCRRETQGTSCRSLPTPVSSRASLHETGARLLVIAKRRAMVLSCLFALIVTPLEEALLPKRGTIVDRNGVPLRSEDIRIHFAT